MPTINLTLDVTADQLIALLSAGKAARVTKSRTKAVAPMLHTKDIIVAGDKVISKHEATKTLPELNVSEYLRTPGSPTGVQGHPFKLNDMGLKKVWDLYNDGFNSVQISKAFAGVLTPSAVRRMVKRIAGAGKEKA